MIRLFNVYYPVRTLVLLIGEALIVWTSFLLGALLCLGDDTYIALNYEHGVGEDLRVTLLVLLCSHWFDLYDTARLNTQGRIVFPAAHGSRTAGVRAGGVSYVRPNFSLGNGSLGGRPADPDGGAVWLADGFTWLIQLPILIERVYVLGTGERAQRLVLGLRQNPEIGVEVASWTGKLEGAVTKESVAVHLLDVVKKQKVHRVIVAMPDRRGTIPMQELLDLRMQGVKIEEATTWLERISGKIEVENLYPSWLVFGDGFRRSTPFRHGAARHLSRHLAGWPGPHLAVPSVHHACHPARFRGARVLYGRERVGKGGSIRRGEVPHHAPGRRDAGRSGRATTIRA